MKAVSPAPASMTRAARIHEFWNWLPVFRVVAECEHIPTAATRLHVSASAISRTIGLLEDRLGQRLFERAGRNLRLNSTGEALLGRVRDAMRLVDEGTHVTTDGLAGFVRISVMGALSAPLARALGEMLRMHPDLQPIVSNMPLETAHRSLLIGDLDLAFYDVDCRLPESLSVHRLGSLTNSAYCGVGHPLFARAHRAALHEVCRHPFAAPAEGATSTDGWPPEIGRSIRVQATQQQMGLMLALHGGLLAVMPDVVASPWVEEGALRRLAKVPIAETPIFAAHRRSLVGAHGPAEAVLHAVREQLFA